ncbi:LOW QUALITY PROTEIN: protein moonraker [Phycodurus eques]|uniref:LOW QUALITY PROTEIN: protein moonraker n=1 Tax=Phycodurus eques TaxID=693459 RepID=UPI002ACD42D6|nr:LOW QUALITY PROTEIN: protein moonraker [Phycodurus eques]
MISFGQQTSGKEWVVLASNRNTHNGGYLTTGTSQTKLLFNEAVPASFRNRATAVGPPAAIVIEKLLPLPPGERQKDADGSVKSSVSFSSLSEEKLQAAVDLVKRDLRRSRFQAMCRSSADPSEDASVLDICNMILPQMTAELSLKERLMRPGSKHPAPRTRPVASKQIGRLPTSSRPAASVDQQHLLRREVCKRQNELESLKKGLNPEVNQLGARQPQDTTKKPPIACRLHNLRPPLTRHTIHKTTDNPDQQGLLKQEIFKLQNERLEHSDSAIVQGRTSNSSEASAAKKSADNVSKKPPIGSKLSWTKDPIPKLQGTVAQRNLLGQEMYKLDAELESYLRQVEKLSDRVTSCVNNEHNEDDQLEPGERKKLDVRWQKQSERSARSIYCLQQQVKEIQQYIEKLHNQDMWDDKKSTAIQRLGGVHRGTLKTLQVVTHQLADQYNSKLPSYCGELSRLICQLSLCSARLQVEPGSPLPETAADILSKLEILDYAISKHKTLQAMQDRACHQQRKQSTRAPKGSGGARRHPKGTNPPRSSHARRMAMQKRQGPDRLQRVPQQHKRNSPGKKEHQATNVKGNLGEQDAHFKEPTVSSRLRVNQLPHRESTVPWIPASSHSLSPPRSCHKTTSEPRCLSSPAKPSSSLSPPKVSVGFSNDAHLNSEKMRQAQNEALRGAWLDKTTAQRLEDLNQLTREEAEHVQRLRAEVVSPTQWAERAEQQARDKIRPLLDEAKHLGESWSRSILSLRNKLSGQAAMRVPERAEQADEALPEDLLEEAAQRVLQAPTLEGMLERMEEIQRDQEQVRRRVASIAYSDGLQWDQSAGSQVQVPGSGPSSPQPIRLTRPVLRQSPAADIVLEEPVETGVLSESSLMEEASREVGPPIFPGPKESGAARMVLSVSGGMLRSIRHYREDYEAYLRHAAHEGGSADVNFWSIADSLAEELLWDAAADVAAEFQDVMEECAEAVFTAEFLQLIHSPRVTSSSSSLVNQ